MSITSDRIRENGFIHALADDAANEIDGLEKENAALLEMNGTQAKTITDLRTALKKIIEWTERYSSPGHPITTVAKRALDA